PDQRSACVQTYGGTAPASNEPGTPALGAGRGARRAGSALTPAVRRPAPALRAQAVKRRWVAGPDRLDGESLAAGPAGCRGMQWVRAPMREAGRRADAPQPPGPHPAAAGRTPAGIQGKIRSAAPPPPSAPGPWPGAAPTVPAPVGDEDADGGTGKRPLCSVVSPGAARHGPRTAAVHTGGGAWRTP